MTNPCPNGVCLNNLGSFECECQNGYEKDSFTGDCINIDECQSGKHRWGYTI